MSNILITGGAGFVGFSLAKYLCSTTKHNIVLVDNLNDYYDVGLKESRLKNLKGVQFYRVDICDRYNVTKIFNDHKIDVVVNLAAQAGVRYARINPKGYIDSNIQGFFNLIDIAAEKKVSKFIYASSSSVYGNNVNMPFMEGDACDNPMSLYAATKLADEAMAAAYFHTHKLQTIGLRFFNVYGPWGRPDMAYYKWTEDLFAGREIELRNDGEMWRDMTYVDDVTKSIKLIIELDVHFDKPEVYNIGNEEPVKILDVLTYISKSIDIKPIVRSVPKGDEEPIKTWSDTSKILKLIGFAPNTNYEEGLKRFIEWYKNWSRKV